MNKPKFTIKLINFPSYQKVVAVSCFFDNSDSNDNSDMDDGSNMSDNNGNMDDSHDKYTHMLAALRALDSTHHLSIRNRAVSF